jgi:hypothetical protein
MSLLPQRKKSAEEIAKLRESLGIPGISAGEDEASAPAHAAAVFPEPADTIVPAHHEATVVHSPEAPPLAPHPAPVQQGPKPVHSLKRSVRIPALPVEDPPPAEQPAPPPRRPKRVRSLRKSEQIVVLTNKDAVEVPVDSRLPAQRHSDRELNELRRREALAMLAPAVANPKLTAAHPALLIPGYLLAAAGAVCFYFYQLPLTATACCAASALLIAAFIFQYRPISRHHAAFIAVITLFVIVFGALHYFPQLRHAT